MTNSALRIKKLLVVTAFISLCIATNMLNSINAYINLYSEKISGFILID